VAMARPWAAASWKAYLPKLYAGKRPADFDTYRSEVIASIRRPGHAKAFSPGITPSHSGPTSPPRPSWPSPQRQPLVPRAALDETRVIERAEQIADEVGLANLTLAALAQRLGARQPLL
jgi:hypothetical protein